MSVFAIDTILSDPLLIVASVLLIAAPILFVVSVIMYFRASNAPDEFSWPVDLNAPPRDVPEPTPFSDLNASPPFQTAIETTQEVTSSSSPVSPVSEQTGDFTPVHLQFQIEIAMTEIKMLQRKVASLEAELESVSRIASAKLDANELKNMPATPEDMGRKLLTLAEHVIVLEREMVKLKSGSSVSRGPSASVRRPTPPLSSL